jgi:hypothetical protein
MKGYVLRASLVLLLLVTVYAQSKPEITVSRSQVKLGETLLLKGTGFTPNRSAISHLKKPDGSEYHPLRFRIDTRGEFTHQIDTVMLEAGTFELWVEDEASKVVSNRTEFKVE